jgi:hypothetical protein
MSDTLRVFMCPWILLLICLTKVAQRRILRSETRDNIAFLMIYREVHDCPPNRSHLLVLHPIIIHPIRRNFVIYDSRMQNEFFSAPQVAR